MRYALVGLANTGGGGQIQAKPSLISKRGALTSFPVARDGICLAQTDSSVFVCTRCPYLADQCLQGFRRQFYQISVVLATNSTNFILFDQCHNTSRLQNGQNNVALLALFFWAHELATLTNIAVMRNKVLCKGLQFQCLLEPQHGLLRQRTSSIAGNDRREQPPDTHAKRYTKKFGAHAVLLAPL